jgi:cytochrome c-type biogenesis protein CcmH/NrfG
MITIPLLVTLLAFALIWCFVLVWCCAGLVQRISDRTEEIEELRTRLDALDVERFATLEISKVAINTSARLCAENFDLQRQIRAVYKEIN